MPTSSRPEGAAVIFIDLDLPQWSWALTKLTLADGDDGAQSIRADALEEAPPRPSQSAGP